MSASGPDLVASAKEQGLIKPEPPLEFADKYPLHQKLMDNKDRHEVVQDFVNWWYDEVGGLFQDENGREVDFPRFNDIIGAFLEVDPDALEAEKSAMLESIRQTGGI